MTDARSLTVQSILYENEPEAVIRAAVAVTTAAKAAVAVGEVDEWSLRLGDSSTKPVLDTTHRKRLDALCSAAGGAFSIEFFGENLGHGGGQNRLAATATSQLLLFLNPDALLAPESLTELVRSITGGVGVADARQIPLDHPKEYEAGQGDTNWCAGACMITSRAIFESVGGFDAATFFMYCDDVDYSWRVRLAGRRAVHVPAARVFHDKRLTASGGYQPTEAETYYSAEAALLLAHKYSRPARVRSLSRSLRGWGTEPALRAVSEYQSRRAAGTLPAPIDGNHRVAEFVGQGYGRVRY